MSVIMQLKCWKICEIIEDEDSILNNNNVTHLQKVKEYTDSMKELI